jgi:hypothetical protein
VGSMASRALGRHGDDGNAGSGRSTALQPRGRHHGLRNGTGCTASWAQGGHHCCGLENVDVGLETAPVWLTASSARVGEDGGA